MRGDDHRIDLAGLERCRHVGKRLQRLELYLLDVEAFELGDLADLIMERGADLGDAQRPAGKILELAQPIRERRVRSQDGVALIAERAPGPR